MFNIFNNTDSKYMNKYRTIMFNLKAPKNKGLFYSVIRGEVSPFRLARMSQRDMQATKVSEPSKRDAIAVEYNYDRFILFSMAVSYTIFG
uniref:TFIIS central domain-containing protein n=1 Tax=Hucho hucho TaxID=62062 RepID=A0A4W5N750_9TELE